MRTFLFVKQIVVHKKNNAMISEMSRIKQNNLDLLIYFIVGYLEVHSRLHVISNFYLKSYFVPRKVI